MNIDLLISKTHDVGLVTTGKFDTKVTAVMVDHGTQEISLEFGETMDSMPLNIPVGEDLMPYIRNRNGLYIIGTDKTHIHEAYHVPIMHMNLKDTANVGEWT